MVGNGGPQPPQPLDPRIVERTSKLCKDAAKVNRDMTALVEDVRRLRGREEHGWETLVEQLEASRGARRDKQRERREAQRRRMEQLRVRVEQLRVRIEALRQQRGRWVLMEERWVLRRRERELQRLQERVAAQEGGDRRGMVQEEEGARFLARNVGRE